MILNLSCVEDSNFESLHSPEIFLMPTMVARMFTVFIKTTPLTQRTCLWPGHLNGTFQVQDISQSLSFEAQENNTWKTSVEDTDWASVFPTRFLNIMR